MYKHPSTSPKLPSLKFLSATFAGIAFSLSTAQAFTWTGATSSDPTVASNYSDPSAPTFGGGASNSGGLFVSNGDNGSAMSYGSAQGSTVFTGGSLRIGQDSADSELDVSGGNLTINSSGTSTLGYHGAGTISVSGGTLSILGSDAILFGNETAGTANVSGGSIIIGNQFLFGRDGGRATINLSGNGVFNVTNSLGTQYATGSGSGLPPSTATINLSGNSIFEQTGSNSINLTNNFYINFTSGSSATFSLLGSSASSLQGLISGGHFEIDGVVSTSLSDFSIIGAPTGSTQGTIQLASPIPEPSTYAVMLGGVSVLFAFKRIKRNRSTVKLG